MREELANLGAHAKPYALEIDRHDAIPFIFFVIGGSTLRAADACVVEGAVEPAVGLHRGRDQSVNLGGFRHVAAMELRLAAVAANHLDGLAAALLDNIRDKQARTFAGKNQRGGASNSGTPTGYNRAFAVKKLRHP